MQNLKAIIFDLGGVILNIDYNKTLEAFCELGVVDFDEMYTQKSANPLFEKLEVGKVTNAQFFDEMRSAAGRHLSDLQITKAWNAMLLDFRLDTLTFIENLRPRYKVFLLSNTNSIHLDAFYKTYANQIGTKPFEELFDGAYYSHQIGFRKPDSAAYQFVIEKNKLKSEECLFIDDSYQNIEGANLAGLNTIYLTPAMKVERLDL